MITVRNLQQAIYIVHGDLKDVFGEDDEAPANNEESWVVDVYAFF